MKNETAVQIFAADQLLPWPDLNPRTHFDETKLGELTESIREHGVLQPVLVHETGEAVKWVVAGETRWRAARAAGADVPAIVRTFTFAQALRIALIENMQRNDLTPIEEGRALKRLLEAEPDLTQEQLAQQIGKSQEYVSNRVRMTSLPDELVTLLDEGVITPTQARDEILPFTQLTDPKMKSEFFARLVEELRSFAEDGQLRTDDVHEAVTQIANDMSYPISGKNHWQNQPLFDAKLHAKCGCGGPRFRYDYGDQSTVRCFNAKWWKAAQADAEKKAKEKEAKRQEKASKAADDAPVRVMTREEQQREFGWRLQELGNELLDPAELKDTTFVIVSDHWNGPAVYCTDEKAVARAKRVVNAERTQMIKERKDARAAADRKAAAKKDITPDLLAEILIHRPYSDRLHDVGRELGLEVTRDYDSVRSLAPADITLLFKVLALRYKRGDYESYGQDPIDQEVEGILNKRYKPSIGTLKRKLIEKHAPELLAEKKAKKGGAAKKVLEAIGVGVEDE